MRTVKHKIKPFSISENPDQEIQFLDLVRAYQFEKNYWSDQLLNYSPICKKANIENNHFILNLLIKKHSKVDSQIDIAVVGNNTIRPTKQNPLRITIFEIKNYSGKYLMSDDDVIDIFDKCDK